MTKRYKIEHTETYFDMTVEIDHSQLSDGTLRGINDFWSDSEYRLDTEDGDLLRAVLKLLCQFVMSLQVEYGYNTAGLVDLFDWDTCGGGQEGWPKLAYKFSTEKL